MTSDLVDLVAEPVLEHPLATGLAAPLVAAAAVFVRPAVGMADDDAAAAVQGTDIQRVDRHQAVNEDTRIEDEAGNVVVHVAVAHSHHSVESDQWRHLDDPLDAPHVRHYVGQLSVEDQGPDEVAQAHKKQDNSLPGAAGMALGEEGRVVQPHRKSIQHWGYFEQPLVLIKTFVPL